MTLQCDGVKQYRSINMKLFRKNITFYGPWIMTRRGVNRVSNKDFNYGGCYAHFIDEYSLLFDESEW